MTVATADFQQAKARPVAANLIEQIVELPFDSGADRNHGYKALGLNYPSNSIAWYRRTFDVPKTDETKRIWLTFDGVFRDATVWVHGH